MAITSSLSWHLLPENVFDLPLDIEEDAVGEWSEIWLRPYDKPDSDPYGLFERAVGVKWVGFADRAILVYADKFIIDLEKDKTRFGRLDVKGERVTWQDGTKQDFVAYKGKPRRKRSRKAKKVNFGKVVLPPLKYKQIDIALNSFWGVEEFLIKAGTTGDKTWNKTDVALIQKLNDPGTNILKIRYANSCGEARQSQLEKIFEKEIEPKLSCWGEQNPQKAMHLITALLQKPTLECVDKVEESYCGKSSLPIVEGFFISHPKIEIAFGGKCKEQQKNTLLHETLHLAGIKDGPEMEKAIEQAESCASASGQLTFSNETEEFYNDLQTDVGMKLFRKIREEAVDKAGWSEGDRAYVLGQICTKMGDKFCARRYFQLATEMGSGTNIKLTSGKEVSFKAVAHFALFDSVVEDRSRMHELARYLKYDPTGVLINRTQTESHLVHEYFAARKTLEHVKENKGICNDETDDKVSCEDLGEIIKTPWFKEPK